MGLAKVWGATCLESQAFSDKLFFSRSTGFLRGCFVDPFGHTQQGESHTKALQGVKHDENKLK